MINNEIYSKVEIDKIIIDTEKFLNEHLSSYNKAIKRIICKTKLTKEIIEEYRLQKTSTFKKYMMGLLKPGNSSDFEELILSHNTFHKLLSEVLSKYNTNQPITETLFNNLYFHHNKVINSLNDILNRLEFAKNQIDSLTGLWGQDMFFNMLTHEYNQSKKTLVEFSLVFFDLDMFKSTNDKYGHEACDYLLKTMSKNIKTSLRKDDIFGRWAGKEFIILLPKTKLKEAFEIITKIKDEIERSDFIFENQKIKTTCSFGISKFDFDTSIKDTIKEAESLRYKAKQSGRNTIVLSTQD